MAYCKCATTSNRVALTSTSIPPVLLSTFHETNCHILSLDHCDGKLETDSLNECCLVASSPPYSPTVAHGVFSFVSRSSSGTMRPRSRLRRLFSIYAKFILLCGMLFTCLLLLEAGSFEGHYSSVQKQHSGAGDESEKRDTAAAGEDGIPRLRRALFVNTGNRNSKTLIRDGPLFDLGDGYAATKGADVIITVKTSKKYHQTRVKDVLDTWFRLAPEQIYFITDTDDDGSLNARIGEQVIPTHCPAGHNRHALCCKQSMEYETYLKHKKSWWCHFDDDNYVNVPQLMRTLSQYDPRQDWYLGKPSTKGPIEPPYRDSDSGDVSFSERTPFWFATGGAGFCISRSLALKMRPYAADGRFLALCDRIRLPDDVTIGFLVEVLLEKNLTVVPRFHSHLENMRSIDVDKLHEQVTLSGGSYDGRDSNLVNVDTFFPDADDPRRFRSLHCHLYPMAAVCKTQKR